MKSIKKNIFYNTIYQVLILIIPFITTPYVSRILLSDGIGRYSYSTAIVKYFWLLALLGMANYGNREIAKSRDSKENLSYEFWNLYYFQLIVSIFSTLLYIIYCFFTQNSENCIVNLCQIPYILSAVFEVSWLFYGLEEFKLMVMRNGIIKVITAMLIFGFVREKNDVWIYTLINSISLLCGQLFLWPILLKKVNFCKPDLKKIKSHLKPNLVLFISVIAVSLYTIMDKIMIGLFSSTNEVGYYENAEKIMNICIGIVGSVGAVMLPRMSYLVEKNDKEKINEFIAKSLKYVMILAIAISFGIAGISIEFAPIFFGNDFFKCGILILCISPAIIFYSWSNIIRTQFLLPTKRDNVFVIGTILAALINLIFNLVLIPKIGSLGAIIATVLSQITETSYQNYAIRKDLSTKIYMVNLIPFVIFGLIMFAFCRTIPIFMNFGVKVLIIQILVGAVIYITLTLIYLILSKDYMVLGVIRKYGIVQNNRK